MNLRVDLILESEQRSANALNTRSLTRIVSVAVPVLVVAIVVGNLMRVRHLERQVQRMEAIWADLHPKQESAKARQGHMIANRGRLAEAELWQSTRLTLPPFFDALRDTVPATMQLTELHWTEEFAVADRRGTMRGHLVILAGKADGASAKDDVERLTWTLMHEAPFSNVVANAFVPPGEFKADSAPDAPESRRQFRIRCELNPVAFVAEN